MAGTTSDKLALLRQIKEAFRAAITGKGQTISDDEPYSAWPAKVSAIETGIQLPTLTNPGGAGDLRKGKQLIDQEGQIVDGTLEEVQQATPSISVSSSGLITAEAGAKSATKQLSSADDSDFAPYNILKGRTIFGITGTVSQKHFVRLNESDLTGAGSNYFEFKVFTGDKWSSYGHDLLAICLSVKVNTPNNIKCFNLSAWNTNYLTTDKGIDLYWVNRDEVELSSTYSSSGDWTKLGDTVRVTCTYDATDEFDTYVTIRVESSDFGTLGLTNSSNYYIRSLSGFVMLFEDD